MEARTKTCQQNGHPEFVLNYERKLLPSDLEWLIEYLERSVSEGKLFRDGQALQIGWMLVRVKKLDNGMMTLMEPDMVSMPIRWVRSVDNTLMHLRRQRAVGESIGMARKLQFPTWRSTANLCSRFKDSRGFWISRIAPKEGDSGWFFGCVEDDHDHTDEASISRISLYEAACEKPAVIEWMALPPGSSIFYIDGRLMSVAHDERPLQIRRGSYLDRKYRGSKDNWTDSSIIRSVDPLEEGEASEPPPVQ